VHERLVEAFPFFSTLFPRSRDAILSKAIGKKLAHKQVLASDGAECAFLPFVVEGTLRIYKASESGREITLYRIERGESCVLSATCILNGGGFPAIAGAVQLPPPAPAGSVSLPKSPSSSTARMSPVRTAGCPTSSPGTSRSARSSSCRLLRASTADTA